MVSSTTEAFKIPGTSWLVRVETPENATISKMHNIQFLKGNHVYHSFTIKKDGDLHQIFDKFIENEQIDIPDNRISAIITALEEAIYVIDKSLKSESKTGALTTMINLSEMKNKKILICGLAGAGKTSIYQVIFEGVNSYELSNLPATRGIQRYKRGINSEEGYNLFVWDLGGQQSYLDEYHKDADKIFPYTTALIYVIDAGDPKNLEKAIEELKWSISQMKTHSPDGMVYSFIHKMDQFPNPQEQFMGIRNLVENSIKQLNKEVGLFPTSIHDDSVFEAWEQIFKSIIPKSKKLNIVADNLKAQTGLYNVLVLEKRTGLPICSSTSLSDDIVIVGTINKLWLSILKLIGDLELVNLDKITVQCENGLLSLEEFVPNIILMLISPSMDSLENQKNRKLIEEFKQEMKKYIN
jgi:GTPase SAR1 family protein